MDRKEELEIDRFEAEDDEGNAYTVIETQVFITTSNDVIIRRV